MGYLLPMYFYVMKHGQSIARATRPTLSEIKLVKQEIDGLQLCTYSQPSAESRKIINVLGLYLPKEKLFTN